MENLIFIEEKKFKNNAISITIPFEMDYRVTDYNLIAAILKRGCNKYKNTKDIWVKLQELYGAVFDIVVSKKGEMLFMNFYISFLNNKYSFEEEDLLKEAIAFLKEIIENNYIENGCFNEAYFNQEKQNLKDLINSKVDDKTNYAMDRVEEICTEGEPYAIYKYGELERLDNIEVKALTDLWIDIKKTKTAWAFLCGDFDKDKVKEYISNIAMLSNKIESTNKEPFNYKNKDVKIVREPMEVSQGKLSLCYRTYNNIFEGDYFALSLMSSVLGGGPHSKLFNEVREKNSLAYYSYSFIEKFKGILTISSGVDFKNFEKAKDIILKQVEAIKAGEISDEELESSKSKIMTSLNSIRDSQYSTLDYISALRINNIDYSLEEVIDGIKAVDKERIIKVAKDLELGAIHYIDKK